MQNRTVAFAHSPPNHRQQNTFLQNGRQFLNDTNNWLLSRDAYAKTDSVIFEEIQNQLADLGRPSQISSGLERLLAISVIRGKNASFLLPAVIKCISVPSIRVRRLASLFLEYHAYLDPDVGLLAVNTFQRDLTDQNAWVRVMALRVLAAISPSIPGIVSMTILALQQGCQDRNPFVRRVSALLLPGMMKEFPENLSQLQDLLLKLLNDESVAVVGPALFALQQVHLDLATLHIHFRKICYMLPDMEEWTQESEDPDYQLMLDSCITLLNSQNTAVTVSACAIVLYAAHEKYAPLLVGPLLRLLALRKESEMMILACIETFARKYPHLLRPYYRSFFLREEDDASRFRSKMDILLAIISEDQLAQVHQELTFGIHHHSKHVCIVSIQTIQALALKFPTFASQCIISLLDLLTMGDETVITEAVLSMRSIAESTREPFEALEKHLPKLMWTLDIVQLPTVRTSIVWMLRKYMGQIRAYIPDCIRLLIKNFGKETEETKLQIIWLTVAFHLDNPEPVQQSTQLLFTYLMELGKYDPSYHVRDWVRIVHGLNRATAHQDDSSRSFLLAALQSAALTNSSAVSGRTESSFTIGTLSHLLNEEISGYQSLPILEGDVPDGRVRDLVSNFSPWVPPGMQNLFSIQPGLKASKPKANQNYSTNQTERIVKKTSDKDELEAFFDESEDETTEASSDVDDGSSDESS